MKGRFLSLEGRAELSRMEISLSGSDISGLRVHANTPSGSHRGWLYLPGAVGCCPLNRLCSVRPQGRGSLGAFWRNKECLVPQVGLSILSRHKGSSKECARGSFYSPVHSWPVLFLLIQGADPLGTPTYRSTSRKNNKMYIICL